MIAGGGTGGHLFPGLALAEEFKRRDSDAEVIFVGTEHGLEAKIIPREGYPIKFLRAEGIAGRSILMKIKAVRTLIHSLLDARRMMRAVSPDIVIGVGGYASGAIVFVAHMKSIATMIHEQNSVPGITNRILGKFVKGICVTFQESLTFFPISRTYLVGNPIRLKIFKGEREPASRLFALDKDKFTVLIFGGSSGARSINRAMVSALNHMPDLKDKIQFLHQTGDMDYEDVRESYRKAGARGTVAPFIYQMAEAYAMADIVVSRAGATTVAELIALGKPAILVPYPHAVGRHQEFNALKLKELGAAFMIPDNELRGETLAGYIRELYENDSARMDMRRASSVLGKPDADKKIVDIAMSLIKKDEDIKRKVKP